MAGDDEGADGAAAAADTATARIRRTASTMPLLVHPVLVRCAVAPGAVLLLLPSGLTAMVRWILCMMLFGAVADAAVVVLVCFQQGKALHPSVACACDDTCSEANKTACHAEMTRLNWWMQLPAEMGHQFDVVGAYASIVRRNALLQPVKMAAQTTMLGVKRLLQPTHMQVLDTALVTGRVTSG